MTQIKLRRDTSANFTSANPVLGNGEPAYETDTKKLKIGDGTTAYTQLEYFSAGGGGGSTNITATLPLKIVDGVISLEVDGQTIQIVDGKLHANLDELSNEITNLSGRVTTVEADVANKASKSDLAAKQDKLSPIAPLGINQTTISNLTDVTFLTDTSATLNSEFYIQWMTGNDAHYLIYASGQSGKGATPTSFIQIPFALGDLISFPFETNADSTIGLVFGYWKDGLFYPTIQYKTYSTYGSGSNSYAPLAFVSEAGKSSLEKIATYYGQSSAVSKSALVYHESMPLNATNYIQVTKNAGVPTVNMWFTDTGADYGYTQRMYTSDTTVLENFNKTNVCLLLSYNKSKAINLTKVTRRELGNTVLDPTVEALTTALSTYSNSFDATAKVVTNDLSLAIGSGLSITDGKLTASGGSAPTNMVTTNTTQTITGNKTFRYIGIDDAYGGKTRLGNGQSKIEMAYDGQISLDSATILADQSQNWRVGRYNKAGLIYSASPLKRVGDGPTFTNYDILDSSNLGSHVDGTTIAYADGKLKATYAGVEICDIGRALYVDETKGLRRYLNGQIVDINTNTQAFLNRLKEITTLHPSLLCTEEEWQTAKTMSAFGQVGKFVFNYSGDEIISVRLPRVVNVQGLFDLQNLGMTVGAGLPNIEGEFGAKAIAQMEDTNGAFYSISTGGVSYDSNATGIEHFGFNASRSNPIYGNSTTVQQEAIQYPYFIQIATGQETENNIINEIELNNPYSLFDSKYSDHELNNLSWLKSEGQWNAKAVYTSAYDELLREYNNSASSEEIEGSITFKRTPKGYKIALADQETAIADKYTTDGIAWYYILDTTNEKFKLPRTKFGFEGLRTIVGDDIAESLPNITGRTRTTWSGDRAEDATGAFENYQSSSGGSSAGGGNNGRTVGATFDASRSSSTYQDGAPVQERGTQMYLYFYIGETVQNANLIDAGRIGEQLANCITRNDCKAYITETYQNGTSWYRVYSDGWCEQGGRYTINTNGSGTITFLKEFVDTSYTIFNDKESSDSSSWNVMFTNFQAWTTSQVVIKANLTGYTLGGCWQASGYIA